MTEETCQDCGKAISGRARANVWDGERIICTPCLKIREGAAKRLEAAYRLAGWPNTPWMVHDGKREYGPYTTEEMIHHLWSGAVPWSVNVWREPMTAWMAAPRLFTIPDLSDGRLELRDMGQGDGTYRFHTT